MTETPEPLAPRQEHPIQLPSFEGPLDLLLFLIRRNEIDIYDIPIEEVTRQYLDIIRAMERLDLDIAGDFFVMAATLMYLKSRVLLPANEMPEAPEDDEEDIDPRWELVQQLLEYKKCKEAAELLRTQIEAQQDFLPRLYRHSDEPVEARPLKPSDKIELWNAFNLVLRRLQDKLRDGHIQDEQVTTAERMEAILRHCQSHQRFRFDDLLPHAQLSINFVVSTFLALLELARLKHLTLQQDTIHGDIWCEVVAELTADAPEVSENLEVPD